MSAASKKTFNPDRLDARAFAQAGGRLDATDPLSRFERLSAELPAGVAADGLAVRWSAQGELREGGAAVPASVWLHVQAQIDLPLTCQRCLSPVPVPLTVDRWFRFVADEATAEAEDEDCEEDVLALEPRPSLRALIEDELLMEVPPVPMHEVCPEPLKLATDDLVSGGDGGVEAPQRHPFADLARLKR